MKRFSFLCLLFFTSFLCQWDETFAESDPKNTIENSFDGTIHLTEDEEKWLGQNHVVRVRVGDTPPLHFNDGQNRGICVEYLDLIAERLGFQVEYVYGIPWTDALENIKNQDTVDLLLTGKNVEERRPYMRFSNDYLLMPLVIFSRKDSDFISSIDDLTGKTVAVEKGYVTQSRLMSEFPKINLLVKNSPKETLQAVASGEADAYIGNLAISTYIINQYNLTNLKVASPAPFDNHNQAFVVRNDWPELVSILNKAIRATSDSELSQLRNKWFNVKFEYGLSKTVFLKWITVVIGICLVILLFFATRHFSLRAQIRERKKTEEELIKSRAQLRILVNTIPDLIWLKDTDGLYLSCNHKFERFFGAKESTIVGKSDYDFVDENLANMFRDNDRKAIGLDGPSINEEWLTFSDGGDCGLFETVKVPMQDPNGTVIGVLGVARDITERKRAEDALILNEQRYKSAQRMGLVGNWEYDLATEFFWGSGQAKSIYGFNPNSEHFTPEEVEKCIPERQRVHQALIDLIEKNKAYNLEFEINPISGPKIKFIKSKAELIKNDLGVPLKVVGVIQDITEQKESEREKLILEQKLMQAQKMESIGTLAGGIAHEFNNMLAIIMGNNELLMEEVPQGSLARESTEEIRVAGLRARDVVKQLLTFSRHDDAAHKVMDFTAVVQESMKLVRSLTPVNIKIEQNISEETYPVMGNETQINQLIINLCNNAVDALQKNGGTLTIELLNETIDTLQIKYQIKLNPGQYVKLKVSDNGIGMGTEILSRVFEPYFTTKDIGKGTGIGMAVVHGIVERHGGAIYGDSTPGLGTIFTVFFPVHEGLIEQETVERDILPVGDENILYVDDELSLAKLGKRLLDSLGYNTESISDSEIALEMVRAEPSKFDLLITDMAMPNMTGDQLVIETLKIRQDMPTIICTGYSTNISEKEALDIGIHSYIMKPINKSELAKMVRKVLDEAKTSHLE